MGDHANWWFHEKGDYFKFNIRKAESNVNERRCRTFAQQWRGRDFSEQLMWWQTTWLLYIHPLDHLNSEHWFYISYMNRNEHRGGVTFILCMWLNKKKKVWKAEECGKSYFSVECASTKADINGNILQCKSSVS